MTYEIRVTAHAYQRFQERFFPCTFSTAEAYILGSPVREWIGQGATRVARGDIEVRAKEGAVLTVLHRDNMRKGLLPSRSTGDRA